MCGSQARGNALFIERRPGCGDHRVSSATFESNLQERPHGVSLLYAPLEIESIGSIEKDVFYNGTTFAAGTPLTGIYKFNSYRLSYRYHVLQKPNLVVALGASAKIRDANIVLASEDTKVERTSLGIVPLPHFFVWWAFAKLGDFSLRGMLTPGPEDGPLMCNWLQRLKFSTSLSFAQAIAS